MAEDVDIKQDIVDELNYEPGLDADDIVVTVSDGVATLSGRVPEHFQKGKAERAVWRVAGVRGIVQDVEVLPPERHYMCDDDLASRGIELLRCNARIPENSVQVTARNGWLILNGEVQWQFQREAAADTISGIPGIRGMLNRLRLNPNSSPVDAKACIEKALHRRAFIEAEQVRVHVEEGTVTLEGSVDNELKRAAIREAAWSAPGVVEVVDNLSR